MDSCKIEISKEGIRISSPVEDLTSIFMNANGAFLDLNKDNGLPMTQIELSELLRIWLRDPKIVDLSVDFN